MNPRDLQFSDVGPIDIASCNEAIAACVTPIEAPSRSQATAIGPHDFSVTLDRQVIGQTECRPNSGTAEKAYGKE